jgi:hypothetical protein
LLYHDGEMFKCDYFHLYSDFYLQQVVTLWLNRTILSITVSLVHLLNLHLVVNRVVFPLNASIISAKWLLGHPVLQNMNLNTPWYRLLYYIHRVNSRLSGRYGGLGLLVTWEKLVQKPSTKSKEHVFALVLAWGLLDDMLDCWVKHSGYTVIWSQI